jgi:hypothetical protein
MLGPDAIHRLEPHPYSGSYRLVADHAQSVDDRLTVVSRPREADDSAGPKRRQPMKRCADRLDPLLRIGRALQQRQGQDRRHCRDRRRGTEAGCLQLLQRLAVAARGQLDLPDADPVDPGGRVGVKVLGEAGGKRRDLRDRKRRPDAGDSMPVLGE